MDRIVFRRELDRAPEVGARDHRLEVFHNRDPIFELNHGRTVEPEQVRRDRPRVVLPPVHADEAMRQVEVPAAFRQRQRRRQVDDGEVGIERTKRRIVVLIGCRRGRRRPRRLIGRLARGLCRRLGLGLGFGAVGTKDNETGDRQKNAQRVSSHGLLERASTGPAISC